MARADLDPKITIYLGSLGMQVNELGIAGLQSKVIPFEDHALFYERFVKMLNHVNLGPEPACSSSLPWEAMRTPCRAWCTPGCVRPSAPITVNMGAQSAVRMHLGTVANGPVVIAMLAERQLLADASLIT